MSNRVSLGTWGHEDFHPELKEPKYKPSHTLGETGRCRIPILWLALFRTGDLLEGKVEYDGKCYDRLEVACPPKRAAENLLQAIPHLNEQLEGRGKIDEHAEMLARLVAKSRFQWLTISKHEYEGWIFPEFVVHPLLRGALAGFDGGRVSVKTKACGSGPFKLPAMTLKSHWEVLCTLSDFPDEGKVPPAGLLHGNLRATEATYTAYDALCGCCDGIKPLPVKKPAKAPRKATK